MTITQSAKKHSVFRNRIYEVAKKIPRGKVVTYAQLAALAGNPKAARAVGTAMKENPYMPVVPCHRVVGSDGSMKGYAGEGGVRKKVQMLHEEGVIFNGNRVDLTKSQWKNNTFF